MTSLRRYQGVILTLVGCLSLIPYIGHAATIDTANKYAWSNMGGWVNFAPSMSAVAVTDAALTGYVWSQNDGWINLSPTEGGVLNDGTGVLSGHAWNSSRGWISFTGVTIAADGEFSGTATGDDGYVLTFDCTNCRVVTDWRSSSEEESESGAGSGTTGSRSSFAEETDLIVEPTTPPPSSEERVMPPHRGKNSMRVPPTEEIKAPEVVQVSEPLAASPPSEVTTPLADSPEVTTTDPLDHPYAPWFFLVAAFFIILWYIQQRR